MLQLPQAENKMTPALPKRTAKKKPAKKVRAPATISKKEPVANGSPALREKLKHLDLLPVTGPDSALISTYNNFLLAWRKYLVDFETDPDGTSVTPCDEIGRQIVNTPAHTPEGMLLKINVAAASMGETTSCFPWAGRDFQWDTDKYDIASQIEYDLMDKLRDDLRRLQLSTITGVSPDLAALLRIWRPLDAAANAAMKEADGFPANHALKKEMNQALKEEQTVRFAILHTKARNLADIAAKFSVVKQYADVEDWRSQMEENEISTEGALWSICGDLLALPDVTVVDSRSPEDDCPVALLADRFRENTDRYDEVELDDKMSNDRRNELLEELQERDDRIRAQCAFEKATSVKGALFQMAVVKSIVDEIAHSTAWGDAQRQAVPDEIKALIADVSRILYSATTAIAQHAGISKREYSGDYLIGSDPFRYLEKQR